MKIIILAAGRGRRMLPLTINQPKALIDLGWGKSLLEQQLTSMQKSKAIDKVIIVTGYLADQIDSKIQQWHFPGLKIKTVYNPFYEMADNLISLWLAKGEMNEDFMITNGDNLFTADVFRGLTKNKEGTFLTVCHRQKYGDDDMKVILAGNQVSQVSKLIDSQKAHGESVGLVLVSGKKHRKIFRNILSEIVKKRQAMKHYWLEAFNLMHAKNIPVQTFKIQTNKWQEIDIHPDLEDLKSKFSKIQIV